MTHAQHLRDWAVAFVQWQTQQAPASVEVSMVAVRSIGLTRCERLVACLSTARFRF